MNRVDGRTDYRWMDGSTPYLLSSPVQFSSDDQTGSPAHTQTDYGLCVK